MYNVTLGTKKTLATLLFFPLLSFAFIPFAAAHSGRTDSSGGHNCRTGSCAGTYHYHNGGPAYNPPPVCYPRSTVGKSGNWTFSQNGCNQDVTITWDKGVADDTFSIALSKSAGSDPGPKQDTDYRTFTFKDVKPGTWYINLKAGQSCGWGDVVYWKVDVPVVKPSLSVREEVVSEKERRLLINSYCATSVTSDKPLKNLRPGYSTSTIHPIEDTTYTIYAKSGKEISFKAIEVKYPLPTPIPSPTPTPIPSVEQKIPLAEKQGVWSWLF